MVDLRISGCTTTYSDTQFDVWCSRWDKEKWEHIFEFWCTSSQREKIWKSITPGAVTELYNILGEPYFYDTTYTSSNTIKVDTIGDGNLPGMRSGNYFAVKDYREEIIPHTKYFRISISAYVV